MVETDKFPGGWCCSSCEISEIEVEAEAKDPCSNCLRIVCNCGGSHWGVPIHLISENEPCGQIYVSTPDCEHCSLKSSLVHVIMVNPYSEAEDAGQIAAVVFGSRAEAERKAEKLGSDCYVGFSRVCTGKCSECDVHLCPRRKY